jgi:hypothetical protein
MEQKQYANYSQINPRSIWRTSFGMFSDAGMNLFPSGPNQNPSDFMDLTNVLPSTSGGFRRRWGLNTMFTDSTAAFIPFRTFAYNVTANSILGTADLDLLITTDNTDFRVVEVTDTTAVTPITNTLTFGAFSGHGPTGFATSGGTVGAVTSRDWFYYSNGIDQPKKVCPALFSSNTDSNWGIQAPFALNISGQPTITAFGGTGTGYSSTPTVTISGGGGSGATATAVVKNGTITGFIMGLGGTLYTTNPTVTITDATGINATAVAAINGFGSVSAVLPTGPIILNEGRIYTYAYQNNVTGHVSDIANGFPISGSTERQAYISTTATVQGPAVGVIGDVPAGVGFQQIFVTITPVAGIDTQVTNLILMATSDGGSLQNLFQVTILPLTPPSPAPINFTDTLPDTYSDTVTTGQTLLNQNQWVSTDGSGNTFGITNNTPPPNTIFYPTLYGGRMWATDGINLFFSKSLAEVTSSTGLITSKWEESWPGTNIIPIGLDNEYILGLISTGNSLQIGTGKSVYQLLGTDPTTFSIPSPQFQETGILSNDLLTVVYSQGQPAGYAWITPDLKLIYSDNNTYVNVSQGVYPILSNWSNSFTGNAKLTSFSYGPYNFVVLMMSTTTQGESSSFFLLYETTLQKWYRWEITPNASGPLNSFVYEQPETGYRGLFLQETNGADLIYRLFDPAFTVDYGNVINWSVQTSWQNLGDPLAIKTINEIELMSDETALEVQLFGASTQQVLDDIPPVTGSPAQITIKSAVLSPLGTRKVYFAGVPTGFRYFCFGIFSDLTGTASESPIEVLSHFIVEHFPMVRF